MRCWEGHKEMRVRATLDVWLEVDADSEEEARARVNRYAHAAELQIGWLVAVDKIIEVEES